MPQPPNRPPGQTRNKGPSDDPRAHSVDGATSRLREDIDSGRTGDKVDYPDPAAAPLGTDEEAAGTPTPPGAAEQARRVERAMAPPPRKGARPGLS
ncbi:hypothetical protein FBZ87_106105 [Nitrospirillum amazonense]|uniref:Uncharacterized protein n=1 Tax=Nitrospirillum amazonense TaxID=28077 RepID=A0A560JL01_9PROT|nr:hypothetical protein [Nitrospirillum amazonense]TWB71861.1 hypothetical protein FBZ87_106105 [Nitrospirillum amazonense]